MQIVNIYIKLYQSRKYTNIIRGIFFIVIYTLFLSISSVALAINYYVSPTGNDDNLGTLVSPFGTICKGVTKLKPGDIVYVRTGTYVERIYIPQSGTDISPITIMAYPGESPVIDGKDKFPNADWGYLMLLEGNYIHVSGFEVKNSNKSGTFLGGAGVAITGQYNTVSNMNVHHTWENGIIAQGDYSIVENCQVWQCVLSNSIAPGSKYWSTGLSAARSPVDGIATNVILRHNIVYNNWGEGLSSFEAEGTIIEDNIVYDNWSVNLYLSDTRGALVQRNIVYNTTNNAVGKRSPFTLGDERADKPRSANNIVINNFIYNADLWAFWSTCVPGSGLDNVLIANNTIVNGQIIIGASTNDQAFNKSAIICNNIFSNDNNNPWSIRGTLTNLTFTNNLWSSSPPSSLAGIGDVIGNPELVKTASTKAGELNADYFKLHKTSPAINAGTTISNVTQDFFGNTRDASPDIGADEYIIFVTSVTVTGTDNATTITSNGGNLQMVANLLPEDASNSSIEWSVEDYSGSATINDNGLLTAISDGTVKVFAKAKDGSNTTGFCMVVISNQSLVTNLDSDQNSRLYAVLLSDKLIIKSDNKDFIADYYSLYTIHGVLIQKKRIINEPIEIDISSVPSGIYIICLSNNQEVIPLKIVIP